MDEDKQAGTDREVRCSNPDGAPGETWRDHESDDTWVLVKTCSPLGNWVVVGKELKNP